MLWPFGAVLELVEQEGAEDHIFANNYVPLHWDGMYLETVPEFQVFHCVDAPGDSDGSRTAFSSTPAGAASWPTVASWNSGAAPASVPAQRGALQQPLGGTDSRAPPAPRIPHPAFLRTADRGRRQLHQPLRVPLRRHRPGTARRTARQPAPLPSYHPQAHYAHRWRSDDLVIADNLTLLHGREAFAHRAPRHLRQVHIHAEPALRNPHLQRD